MHLEVKARDIILTDRRFALKLRRHIDKEETSISRPMKEMWKEQSKAVTIETVRKALETGRVVDEWKDFWEKKIREFVRDTVTTAWIKSIGQSGDDVAEKINRIQRKQFDFDTTMTSVKAWTDSKGGALIVDLTEAQMTTIQALLQDQIAFQVTSPYVLAQRIKSMVGLTDRETTAVIRFMHSLMDEGMSPSAVSAQIGRYTDFLHKNRAARIARTELSNGYNFGHLDSLKQASTEGWLPGVPEKDWIAGGADPCDICMDNEGMGYIALDAEFMSGDQHPTAHPHCECSLGSRIRR